MSRHSFPQHRNLWLGLARRVQHHRRVVRRQSRHQLARDNEQPVKRGEAEAALLGTRTRCVADASLVAALPLSMSATPERKSDHRRHEARRDRSFVVAEVSKSPQPRRAQVPSSAFQVRRAVDVGPRVVATRAGPRSRRVHTHDHADGIGPLRGPNLHAVAACLNAGDAMSIELEIARRYPPRPMIAL